MLKMEVFFNTDNGFIEIENLGKTLVFDDLDYIEGAIELKMFGEVPINKNIVDYVDQVLAYFIDNVYLLIFEDSKNIAFYYPDQAFKVELMIKRKNILISTKYGLIEVNFKDFWKVFSEKAVQFFQYLSECDPYLESNSKYYMNRIFHINNSF